VVRLVFRTVAAVVLALALAGCSNGRDRLVVATWWPMEDRIRVESDFHAWLSNSGRNVQRQPVELEWRLVDGWDDWQRELARRHPPDVLLGGRIDSLERLARAGRLVAVGNDEPESWLPIRAGVIRLVDRSGQPASEREPRRVGAGKDGAGTHRAAAANVTFDDPRVDPTARAWAVSLLDSEHFREGYALLVQSAGSSRRLGSRSGAARGAVERGEAELSPLWIAEQADGKVAAARRIPGQAPGQDGVGFAVSTRAPRLVEGAAIVADGANLSLAREFLRFLAETQIGPSAAETGSTRLQPDVPLEELAAELLGATLVDAQDELWAACAAVDRAVEPAPALKWMTEPPPWPPASIARLLARGDSDALTLVETLAREITPDAAVRAELIRSWLAPGRVIDRGVLSDVAHLADGRLAIEPRFRAWLRAEWTAWARQRFRRVERVALARPAAVTSRASAASPERGKAKP